DTNIGILVDHYFATSVPDIYAVGDCAEFRTPPGPHRKNIEQVWYTGRMQGETLAHNLTRFKVSYRPGIWFNSAKLFDVEYQSYGFVPAVETEGLRTFYWEHAEGNICFRAVWEESTGYFIGAHALGLRLRHEWMDNAIRKCWPIEKVMERLGEADFKPEFTQKYYKEIVRVFRSV